MTSLPWGCLEVANRGNLYITFTLSGRVMSPHLPQTQRPTGKTRNEAYAPNFMCIYLLFIFTEKNQYILVHSLCGRI